jgi:hypothetical protein
MTGHHIYGRSNGTISTFIELPNDSLDGLIIWIIVFAVVSVVLLPIYELFRRMKRFSHVYYTRSFSVPQSSFESPSGLFASLPLLFNTPESEVLKRVG